MLSDTAMPCGKTSDRGDGGFRQFPFRVYTSQVKSKPGRRVAGPFWAQAVNQKRQYLQIRIYKSLHFR